jgi:transglutaminase-like putative cysteine protease
MSTPEVDSGPGGGKCDMDDALKIYPYQPFYKSEPYRASRVLDAGRAFCVGTAALLCALGRACGIPSRAGIAAMGHGGFCLNCEGCRFPVCPFGK